MLLVTFLPKNQNAKRGCANPIPRSIGSCAATLLVAVGLAALLSSCSSAVAPPPTNVILITIDTLRADRLGCYGNTHVETPTTDALARDGVLFERAIAQVPLTTPSHAAILTGTYPIWNGMRDWSDPGLRSDVPTLAEVFKKHSYGTAAFVSAFVLDSMWGLNRGFDHYDDWFRAQDYTHAKRQSIERSADKTVDRAIAWLQSRRPGPFFLWVHLYDPHAPYQPPEPFKSRYRGRPYDGEVAYTDQQLGRLMQFLRGHGLYSSALIVLTSDHGEALGEHQEQEHGYFIYEPSIHVPLVMKFPAGFVPALRRIPDVVNTIDVAPTLTQFCAFPSDELRSFQGRSLLTLATKGSEGTPRYGYSESLYPRSLVGASALFGLQTKRYHYIRAPHEELYDLQRDPQEKHNVLRENPTVAAALREELRGILTRYKPAGGPGAMGRVDPETAEKLRSLGYVSLSIARPPGEFDPTAPDPKELIGTYDEILRSIDLADRGSYREANARLAALARKHPKIYLLPFLEGENLRAARDARGAIVQYRRALEINPLFDQAAMGLGHAAYAAEKNSEAAKAFDLALQLNPRNFPVRLALAKVYWRLGRLNEAAAEQLKVLDSHPNLAQAHAEYGITLVRLKRYAEALPALTKGIELGFRNAEVYNFMANAYTAEGRVDEAIQAYEQAIALDPKYPTPYVNLALIYDQRGQHKKSREYYQKACRLSPELCRQLAAKFR
jgi:choline-sulfatase